MAIEPQAPANPAGGNPQSVLLERSQREIVHGGNATRIEAQDAPAGGDAACAVAREEARQGELSHQRSALAAALHDTSKELGRFTRQARLEQQRPELAELSGLAGELAELSGLAGASTRFELIKRLAKVMTSLAGLPLTQDDIGDRHPNARKL